MKKLLSYVLVLILFLTVFSSYGEAATRENVKVEARKIETTEDDLSIRIIYPYLSGFYAAEKLNDTFLKNNINSIGYIREAYGYIKELKEQQKKDQEEVSSIGVSLESFFDYNFSGNIMSLIFNSYDYTGGAHGIAYKDSFTVNTKTNEIYNNFGSLFNSSSNYKKVILEKINKLIDKEKDMYFDDAKKTVAARNSDYKFYIDGNKLVIYFGLYELRPYAGGMSVFEINAKELKGLLKSDIYNQMINAKPLEKVRYNGTSMNPQPTVYEKEYSLMVPLKTIAELLGYKVSWNGEKGWAVDDGYIKNKVNSYYSSKTGEKTQLGLAPQAKGNTMYVPSSYFSQVLKEEVYYDGEALRIFNIDDEKQSLFDKQIVKFIEPVTADNAVELYAEAIVSRNGALQYALYSDTLKAAKKDELEELNWVTGVSSPWASSYDIKKTGENSFDLVFQWETSAGKEPDTVTKVKVTKIPNQEKWRITEVK